MNFKHFFHLNSSISGNREMSRIFRGARKYASRAIEAFRRVRLGIPYVNMVNMGVVEFQFMIMTVESHNWYGSKEDYLHIEGAATEYFMSKVFSGAIVVDVGAHHGLYSMMAAYIIGQEGKVFSFEADKQNYKILRRNAELNNYSQIECFYRFVGEKDSENGTNENYCTLDRQLAGIKPDIIKIDVEGAENSVIRGGAKIIAAAKPVIICELHPIKGADVGEIVRFLKSLGYKVRIALASDPMHIREFDNRSMYTGNDILIAEPSGRGEEDDDKSHQDTFG